MQRICPFDGHSCNKPHVLNKSPGANWLQICLFAVQNKVSKWDYLPLLTVSFLSDLEVRTSGRRRRHSGWP